MLHTFCFHGILGAPASRLMLHTFCPDSAAVSAARTSAKPGCRLDQADGGFARRHSLKRPAPLCARSCCRRDAGAPSRRAFARWLSATFGAFFDQKICGIGRDAGAPRLAPLDSLLRPGLGIACPLPRYRVINPISNFESRIPISCPAWPF